MKSLESLNHELIKAHILDPENSPLSQKHQKLLDRIVSAAKLLDKYPIRKHAIALHRGKFPEISKSQAYEDIKFAESVVYTKHTFDYDFWQNWIINGIIRNIEACKKINSLECIQIIAREHANLIKALGQKPAETNGTTRNEANQYYILIDLDNPISNNMGNVGIDELLKRPRRSIRELNKLLKDLGDGKKTRMK